MPAEREAVAAVAERLEQARAVHARPAAEQQGLGKRGDGLGEHHVQQQLRHRAAPARAAMQDRLRHAVQKRRQPGERLLVCPGHDADCPVGHRLHGPGYGSIDIARVLPGEGGGKLAGQAQRHRAAIDHNAAGARVRQQPVPAQTGVADLRRPRQRQEDDAAIARHPRGVCGRNALRQDAPGAGLRVDIVDNRGKAGAPHEVPAHRPAHGAEPDESEGGYGRLAPA